MLLNLAPLKKYRDYRLLFIGQFVSFFGSMVSYVAVPYQVYELTHDNATVGMMGVVQLVPVLIFGILGGTYADRLNRRKLLLVSELLMALVILGLLVNSLLAKPSVVAIFVLVALLQAVIGFHRPAMEALTQHIVDPAEYAAVGALGSFRFSFCAIAGPAAGGLIIAAAGVKGAYLIDVISFSGSFICLLLMAKIPDPEKSEQTPWTDAKEGLQYALSKPELIGTYLIDIVAMVFAFPVALFPAMAENWGGPKAAGVLFSAMAAGSLIMTIFSGWVVKIKYHGRGVVFAAALWAVFMIGVGFSHSLWVAFAFLALAGAADMVSGLFRGVIWNETIPNTLRGRLSGIEMISYMSGPLLGNARAGWMASIYSVELSLYLGGVVCLAAVIATAAALPQFWRYQSAATKQL